MRMESSTSNWFDDAIAQIRAANDAVSESKPVQYYYLRKRIVDFILAHAKRRGIGWFSRCKLWKLRGW